MSTKGGGGATQLNQAQRGAISRKRLRNTALNNCDKIAIPVTAVKLYERCFQQLQHQVEILVQQHFKFTGSNYFRPHSVARLLNILLLKLISLFPMQQKLVFL
jgi:hypothetical protein